MLTRQAILDFLASNPGATNKQLATFFNTASSITATRTKQLRDKGFITHKVVGRTVSGVDTFGYWVNANVEPHMNKAERVAVAPKALPLVGERKESGKTPSSDINDLIMSLANSMAKQIASQVVVSLQGQLQKELMSVIPPTVTVPKLELPAPVIAKVVKLPKVGVIGIAPPKRAAIDDEFGELLNLVYWWVEDSDSKLKSMASTCEVIFIMDYVAHKHTQLLAARGAKLRRVNGDIRALCDDLTRYYVGELK